MTFAFWEVKAGSKVPEHAHMHEQVAHLIEGEFELTVDGNPIELQPGKVVVIPSNIKHSGIAITDCKLLDVFSPVREDYRI
jgi:quercetin dioxygenase-like cupin family protein